MAGLSVPFLFPFCIPTVTSGDVGAGTLYPFGLSFDDAFELYWRVRRYRIILNASLTSVLDPSVSITATDLTGNTPSPAGITVETQLICGGELHGGILGQQQYFNNVGGGHCVSAGVDSNAFQNSASFSLPSGGSPPFNEYRSRGSIGVFLELFSSGGPMVIYDNSYYPYVRIGSGMLIEDVSFDYDGSACNPAGGQTYLDLSFDSMFPTPGSTVDVTFLGQTVAMSYPSPFGIGGLSSIEIQKPFDVSDGYFGYDPGSGGNIWDTTLGTSLRNPFSVQSWT